MMLGEGGLGISSRPGTHYRVVQDTCVFCHMGNARNHTFEPDLANCQGCHQGLDTFDREGVQTEIQALLDEVKALLLARGVMNEENRSIPGTYPEAVVSALWDYIFVVEDHSKGVHNPDFARALLQ